MKRLGFQSKERPYDQLRAHDYPGVSRRVGDQ